MSYKESNLYKLQVALKKSGFDLTINNIIGGDNGSPAILFRFMITKKQNQINGIYISGTSCNPFFVDIYATTIEDGCAMLLEDDFRVQEAQKLY